MTGVKGNPRQLNFKNLTPFIPGILPHDKGGIQRTLLYLKGVFQQPRRGAAAVAVKESGACSTLGTERLGCWRARQGKKSRNKRIFLLKTLLYLVKLKKLTTSSRPPTSFPLKKAVPQRQKGCGLEIIHHLQVLLPSGSPRPGGQPSRPKALRGNRRKRRKLSPQRQQTLPTPPSPYPQPSPTPNLNKKIVRTMLSV